MDSSGCPGASSAVGRGLARRVAAGRLGLALLFVALSAVVPTAAAQVVAPSTIVASAAVTRAAAPAVIAAPATPGGGAAVRPLGVAWVPASPVPGAKPRTPVRIEVLAGQGQAQGGGIALAAVAADLAPARVKDGSLVAWVGLWPNGDDLPEDVRREPLGWSASPMAIMRTDTDIHDWPALAGRTVCLSADGRHVGEVSARFGAIEQVYPAAADALLALRTGQCDAAVEDQDFLRALLKFPEWRKFSAQLAPYRGLGLVELVRADLPESERLALRRALAPQRLHALAQGQARDVAFEVYLDQTVPDCH